ncbi:hypothetical protein J1N35_019177 [Gossypium stocksii]|uniref:Uncharacterized protein n=1 Tax=Gossypium stocksii TaxID=47602 RepID=A0A9D3VRU8_9ROSI|nr:hypothetical protein J1N35_019177 [Gossypium stocksii]
MEISSGGTKVLSIIQLAKDAPSGENIDLVDQSAMKTLWEMLEVQQTDMNSVESSMRLPPIREVGCALDFGRKVVMQTGQLKWVNATRELVCENQKDPGRGKSQCGQLKVAGSYERDVPKKGETVRVRK